MKKIQSIVVALVLVLFNMALVSSAFATDSASAKELNVSFCEIAVIVNGHRVHEAPDVISYHNAIYFPLAAIDKLSECFPIQDPLSERIYLVSAQNNTIQHTLSNTPKATENIVDSKSTVETVEWSLYVNNNLVPLKNSVGAALPLISSNGILYIPVRCVFEAMGWDVAWTDHNGYQTLYLRSHLTDSEIGEIEAYSNLGMKLICKLRAIAWDFGNENDAQKALELLYQAQECYELFVDTPQPSTQFATTHFSNLIQRVNMANSDLKEAIRSLEQGAVLKSVRNNCPGLDESISPIESSLWEIRKSLYQW